MSNKGNNTALQSQKAVSAYMESKQLLPFGFARQYTVDILYHLCDINNLCNGFLSQYGTLPITCMINKTILLSKYDM